MRPILATAILVAATTLCGCAGAGPAEPLGSVPSLLVEAIESSRVEPEAREACERFGEATVRVAAFVSSASEVAAATTVLPGKTERDLDGLPPRDEAPVLVCIAGGVDDDQVMHYMANWVAEQANASGIMAVFTGEDLGLTASE